MQNGTLLKIAEALEVMLAILLFVRIHWLYQSLAAPKRGMAMAPAHQEPENPQAALERYVDGFFGPRAD